MAALGAKLLSTIALFVLLSEGHVVHVSKFHAMANLFFFCTETHCIAVNLTICMNF